jgi:hypothetical protein
VVTTSATTGAFKWPLHQTAQLVVSICRRAGPAPQSLAPPYTFGGRQTQTDMARELLKAGAWQNSGGVPSEGLSLHFGGLVRYVWSGRMLTVVSSRRARSRVSEKPQAGGAAPDWKCAAHRFSPALSHGLWSFMICRCPIVSFATTLFRLSADPLSDIQRATENVDFLPLAGTRNRITSASTSVTLSRSSTT